jgi:hypothetical protein
VSLCSNNKIERFLNGLLNEITIFLLFTFCSRFSPISSIPSPLRGSSRVIFQILLLQSTFVEVRAKDGSRDRKSKARNGCARFRLRSFFTAHRTSGVRIILGLYVYICTHTRTHEYRQKNRYATHVHDTRATRVCMYHYCITAVG